MTDQYIVKGDTEPGDYVLYTANDGVVKINSGNGLKPRWDDTTETINGIWRTVNYAAPLGLSSSPTTSWPNNIASPTDEDVYKSATGTFIENTVPGQINYWRLLLSFQKQGGQTTLEIRLRNQLSGFIAQTFYSFASGYEVGELYLMITTIADGASLPPPFGTGQGYVFEIRSDDTAFQSTVGRFIQVDSIARVSTHFGPYHK